jgi:hypothetical protein
MLNSLRSTSRNKLFKVYHTSLSCFGKIEGAEEMLKIFQYNMRKM